MIIVLTLYTLGSIITDCPRGRKIPKPKPHLVAHAAASYLGLAQHYPKLGLWR